MSAPTSADTPRRTLTARTPRGDAAAPGWQLDRAGALAYERNLVPVLDGWAADLVEAVAAGDGDHVVDVACGTGIVTRHVLTRLGTAGRVTAVDVNSDMLDVAREILGPAASAVTWHLSEAENLPLDDGDADVVLCQQGMQFFPDPRRALAEMHRVLAPGGRLGVSTCRSLDRQPGYRPLIEVLDRHAGSRIADLVASPYRLGDPERLRDLVTRAGFTGTRVRVDLTPFRLPSARVFIESETSSSPVGNLLDRLDGATADALVEDLSAALAPYTDDDGILFGFETVTVTARRDGTVTAAAGAAAPSPR